MDETLAERFAQERTGVITWEGHEVYASYVFPEVPQHLEIDFISGRADPPQGLFLSVKGGILRLDSVEHRRVITWCRRFPLHNQTVEITRTAHRPLQLRAWNAWEESILSSHGNHATLTNSWQGNAGMLVEEEPGMVRLRCSDGIGEVDFSNLEVVIRFDPDRRY